MALVLKAVLSLTEFTFLLHTRRINYRFLLPDRCSTEFLNKNNIL